MSPQEYHDYLEELAYHFWLSDGKPNGEDYVDTWASPIKIKHIHRIKAEIVADFDLQIFRDLEIIQSNKSK